MVNNFFDKKTASGANLSVNEELSHKLHKPVIKKFKGRRVYARFKDIVKHLLSVIDVFTKYA